MCMGLTRKSRLGIPDSATNSSTCGVMLRYARRSGTSNQSSLRACFTGKRIIAADLVERSSLRHLSRRLRPVDAVEVAYLPRLRLAVDVVALDAGVGELDGERAQVELLPTGL